LTLELKVEDMDNLRYEFMGKVLIPLRPFEDKYPVEKW
jgi:hypothetical protein